MKADLPRAWQAFRDRLTVDLLLETARQYGPYLLAWSAPALTGLAIFALLRQGTNGYVFILQENLTLVLFWACFLAAALAHLGIALRRWVIRRVAAARLEEQQAVLAARRRLLRNLDHELRTPLTTIGLIAERLKQPGGSTAEREEAYDSILQQARRMQTLIKGLRFLVEQDESHLETARVDLAETLQEAVEIVQSAPVYRGQPVAVEIQRRPNTLPQVWGDHDCLVVVFRNLLENAVKYSGADCRVLVRAWQEGNWVVATVSDTGPGIPPEDLPYVFELLYRGKNAGQIPGSGLGLATAARLVHLNHGTLHADSAAGKGTRITVRLPRAKV